MIHVRNDFLIRKAFWDPSWGHVGPMLARTPTRINNTSVTKQHKKTHVKKGQSKSTQVEKRQKSNPLGVPLKVLSTWVNMAKEPCGTLERFPSGLKARERIRTRLQHWEQMTEQKVQGANRCAKNIFVYMFFCTWCSKVLIFYMVFCI